MCTTPVLISSFDFLKGLDAIEAIAPQWRALCREVPSTTPFQTPEWLLPWYRHFGEGPLCFGALWSDGRLNTVAPLFVFEPARELRLLGTGNSDHLDVVTANESGTAQLLQRLAEMEAWQHGDLQQLPAGSPLLRAPAPAGLHDDVGAHDACPTLALPAGSQGLPPTVPKRMRDKLRYYRRRAQKLGAVDYEPATAENLPELMDEFERLHAARWKLRGEPGALAGAAPRHFHREAAREMFRAGMLRMWALRLGGRRIAVYHGFHFNRRAYFYLGGFDPEFDKLSPGTLLLGHAIEEAVREGAREFDFLRGSESYKYAWGARDRQYFRRLLRRTVYVTDWRRAG